jgi:ketosteroid isomerase-like protein
MISANVELVRSIHAAWERGDFSSADWADPEIEYVHADGPEPGSWNGLTGMAHGFREYLTPWEAFRVEAGEYRELDAERVLVLFTFCARGKSSGLEASQIRTEGAQLFHVREGKVTRLVQYLDRDGAFDDLGLAPETGSQGW